jgi:hypothetical protein
VSIRGWSARRVMSRCSSTWRSWSSCCVLTGPNCPGRASGPAPDRRRRRRCSNSLGHNSDGATSNPARAAVVVVGLLFWLNLMARSPSRQRGRPVTSTTQVCRPPALPQRLDPGGRPRLAGPDDADGALDGASGGSMPATAGPSGGGIPNLGVRQTGSRRCGRRVKRQRRDRGRRSSPPGAPSSALIDPSGASAPTPDTQPGCSGERQRQCPEQAPTGSLGEPSPPLRQRSAHDAFDRVCGCCGGAGPRGGIRRARPRPRPRLGRRSRRRR